MASPILLVSARSPSSLQRRKNTETNETTTAVSPWFSTHFGPEVSYSKNWVFPGDLLWHRRWEDILTLQPQFIEIVTWNDYGESHYIGPLDSKHTDDGGSKWVNDMYVPSARALSRFPGHLI